MNKSEVMILHAVSDKPYVVDKSDVTKDLEFGGSWNAYCLAKSSDRFVFSL